MSWLNKLSDKANKVAKNVTSKIGSGELQPTSYVSALQNELDEQAVEVDKGRKVGPNKFSITISTADFDKIEQWGQQEFANELADSISEHGVVNDYHFIGSISVIFMEDEGASPGEITIVSEAQKSDEDSIDDFQDDDFNNSIAYSDLPSAENLQSSFPVVELDGKRFVLNKDSTMIGRGSDCDIILEDPNVSRHHIEIKITPRGTIVKDLNSANGTFVEGHQIPAATLLNGNVITIGKTALIYWEPLIPNQTPIQNSNNSFEGY